MNETPEEKVEKYIDSAEVKPEQVGVSTEVRKPFRGQDIDRKFRINAISEKSGKVYSEKEAMLFLAKDKALPNTLRFYMAECERIGADPGQIESVRLMIERVEKYQRENPELAKIPDVDPAKEAYLLKPNA